MTIDINRYRSISINRLILEIVEQSMTHVFVIIRLGIDFQYQSINCYRLYRLPSIVIDNYTSGTKCQSGATQSFCIWPSCPRSSVTSVKTIAVISSFLENIFSPISTENGHSWPFHNDLGHYEGNHVLTMRVSNRYFVTWTQRKTATTPNNRNHAQSFRESLQINQWKSIICEKILWLSIDHRLANTNRYQLTNSIDWYRLIDWISDGSFSSIKHFFFLQAFRKLQSLTKLLWHNYTLVFCLRITIHAPFPRLPRQCCYAKKVPLRTKNYFTSLNPLNIVPPLCQSGWVVWWSLYNTHCIFS